LGASLALHALPQGTPTPAQQLREIYKELVEINTTDSAGSCTAAAEAMAARLKAGGLPAPEVQVIVPPGGPKKGNLVAQYRGTGEKKPVMLLGHLDVGEAKREDWQRDPFRLVDRNGKYLRMSIQAGEKVFQTYQLEVTNPGGHSSLPVKDNAITHLAGGLARLGAHDFPFGLSDTTRAYFEQMSRIETGQTASDMK